MDAVEKYMVGYWIVWVPTFFISWIYCIGTYGFLLGVGLGWLPSIIAATVAGFLWPLIALIVFLVLH